MIKIVNIFIYSTVWFLILIGFPSCFSEVLSLFHVMFGTIAFIFVVIHTISADAFFGLPHVWKCLYTTYVLRKLKMYQKKHVNGNIYIQTHSVTQI